MIRLNNDTVDMKEQLKAIFKPIVEELVNEILAHQEQQRKDDATLADQMLTRDQLCKRWNITKGTLRNYVNDKKITPLRIGRRVLFPISDVLQAESRGVSKFKHCA